MTDVSSRTWHLITGEYPPRGGGVADYTRAMARALVRREQVVHVWAPAGRADLTQDEGVTVHALEGGFGPRTLRSLAERIDAAGPGTWLVQYVPQAFGMRGINLPFAFWLGRTNQRPWVLFHEVAVPWDSSMRAKQRIQGAIQRLMARLLIQGASQVLVSIPAWKHTLASIKRGADVATWLPIPSTLPVSVAPDDARLARARLFGADASSGPIVGHFGTYGELLSDLVRDALITIGAWHSHARFLLLGRGGPEFAARALPLGLRSRVVAPGEMPEAELARAIAGADLMVQPYPDGITSRRTSVMAALALGRPVATNIGFLSEAIWASTGSVALADGPDGASVGRIASRLIEEPGALEALGRRAKATYASTFSVDVIADRLIAARGAKP